jgi:hypothetical protein
VIPGPGAEDPIAAIFDLSDRVAEMAPLVRRLYRYTATILAVWIILMVIVLLLTLRPDTLFLAVLAALALAAGVIALGLLRQTDRFFRTFVQRHRAIHLMRDAEPIVRIPDGRTPTERLARHLVGSNPSIERLVRETPAALQYRVTLHAGKREVPFDLAIVRPGSLWYRLFGRGDRGFAIIARLGPDAPTRADLNALETDALAVAPELTAAPVRMILLRTKSVPLPEDVYEYAVGHPVYLRRGFGHSRSTLEVITENADGTYEFVPQVLGIP